MSLPFTHSFGNFSGKSPPRKNFTLLFRTFLLLLPCRAHTLLLFP